MATYTATADANGDFMVPFSSNYTSGQKVTVTAAKDGATKNIELFAPSGVTGGGVIQFSGNMSNFPINIGGVTLTDVISGGIGTYAFHSGNTGTLWAKATGLTLLGAVSSIGDYAFQNWVNATSLSLPASLTTVGNSAFSGWSKCLSLILGSNITSLSTNSFRFWSAATSIVFNANVSNIPTQCFQGWSKCAGLNLGGTPITAITDYSFADWGLAIALVLPPNLLTIDVGAFSNWTSCLELLIPNTVTSIATQAFYNWTACKKVTLGTSLASIASDALRNLTACDELICLRSTPPTLASTALTGLKSTCVIKVPSASLAAYQAATNWSTHASKMVGI